MTTSCPPVDARDPGERADQQAVLPVGPLGAFPWSPWRGRWGREQPGFHLTEGESSHVAPQNWDWDLFLLEPGEE